MPMEAVFSHSVLPAEENSLASTEEVICHSVLSVEDRSQMNCASISNMAESPENTPNSTSVLIKQSLSIIDLPLTQEKVESTYADVFQGLGKFPGDP